MHELPRRRVSARCAIRMSDFSAHALAAEGRDDCLADSPRQAFDVLRGHVVALGPEQRVVERIVELHVDLQPIAEIRQASGDHILHGQVSSDRRQIGAMLGLRHGRLPRHDAQIVDARQLRL